MPTPLAHGLAGFAMGRTVRSRWRAWHFAVIAFLITQVPDLDFIPGVLAGDPGMYHRIATHSIFGAMVISVPIAALLAWLAPLPGEGPGRSRRFLRWYAFVLPVYGTHLVLDVLSPDTIHNSGVQILWPLSNVYVRAPIPLPAALAGFFDLEFGPDTAGFFQTFFSLHAAGVFLADALLFSPVLLMPWLAARYRSARRAGGAGARHAPREQRPRQESRDERRDGVLAATRRHQPADAPG